MTVTDILAITPFNINLIIEDEKTTEYTVYNGKSHLIHGKYLNATVDFLRPIENGICLKVTL